MTESRQTDAAALAHLVDEAKLKEKYEEALATGCTPEFAKQYIAAVAGSMMKEEAATIPLRPGVLDALIERTIST